MRPVLRALAVAVGSALVVGLTPGLASAAAPVVTAFGPTGAAQTMTEHIFVTVDDTLSPLSTLSVAPPEGDSGFSCPADRYSGGSELGCVPSHGSTAFAEGTYTVDYDTVLLSDPTRHTTGTFAFTLDHTPPAAPAALALSPSPINVDSWAAETVTVSGRSEQAGDLVTVTLTMAGHEAWQRTVTAGDAGAFSVVSAHDGWSDGTLTAAARSTDPAGNVGAVASVSVRKDTVAPALVSASPEEGTPARASDGVTVVADEALSTASSITLQGADGAVVPVTTSWSSSTTLGVVPQTPVAEGPYDVTIDLVDVVGNRGAVVHRNVVLDGTAPPAPTLVAPEAVNLVNQAAYPVSGTGEPGATLVLRLRDRTGSVPVTATTTVDPAGAWAVQLDLHAVPDGAITLTAAESDAVGNAAPLTVLGLIKDTVSPEVAAETSSLGWNAVAYRAGQPAILRLRLLDDGQGAPLAARVSVDDADPMTAAVVRTVTADQDGGVTETFSLDAFGDGAVTGTVVTTDAAGNDSDPRTFSTVKDTVAPAAPAGLTTQLPFIGPNQVAGELVRGTTEPDALITLTADDEDPATAGLSATWVALSTGAFLAGLDLRPLRDGLITFTATATDKAGNVSVASAPLVLRKDLVAPAVPDFTVDAFFAPGTREVVVTGTTEPGALVYLVAVDDAQTGPETQAEADSAGAFTAEVDTTGLRSDLLAVGAIVSDVANNQSQVEWQQLPTVGELVARTATAGTRFATRVTATLAVPADVLLLAADDSATVRGAATVDPASGELTGTVDLTRFAPGKVEVGLLTEDEFGNTATYVTTATRAWGSASVALRSLPTKITAGGLITLSGALRRSDPSVPARGVVITGKDSAGHVRLRVGVPVATVGTFGYQYRPMTNLTYSVAYVGDSRNRGTVSVARTVFVASRVTASAPSGSATRKQVVTGTVSPNKAGRSVTLYRLRSDGSKVKLSSAVLSATSAYRFTVTLPRGTSRLLVVMPAATGNVSGSVRFTATRT